MKLRRFKNNYLSIRCTLNFSEYKMFSYFVMSVCGCLSIHTAWRGVHIMVYISQRLPITLIKSHTTQGDYIHKLIKIHVCLKTGGKSTQAQKIDKLVAKGKDSEG